MNSVIKRYIEEKLTKFEPEIVKSNEDGVFVTMLDFEERFLFYIFQNPIDNRIQVNEISGYRRRWNSTSHLAEWMKTH